MVTLEQVEKLRERANVSYDEAKAALEQANGDILEALIDLEKKGSVAPPPGGGYYSSEKSRQESTGQSKDGKTGSRPHKEYQESIIRKFFRFCGEMLHRGNINSIDIIKDGEVKTTLSVTILLLLTIFFFWITVPLMVIGLFCGFTYRFRGPDLGKEAVNSAMDTAANAAETLKKSIMEGQGTPKE
jgi:hypothetical protein